MIDFGKIPEDLTSRRQWVLWKIEDRNGKPTKLPYQVDGKLAKSDTKETWNDFAAVRKVYESGGYSGVGYVFDKDDPFCGIDLDGCRDGNGHFAIWAVGVLIKFKSYSEISPSGTGIKIFCRGKSPFATGKNVKVNEPAVSEKVPGVEIYDSLRYFAVTGNRDPIGAAAPIECDEALLWLKDKFWPSAPPVPVAEFRSNDAVLYRAGRYIAKLPASVSGAGGHNAAFRAACVLVCGFSLSESEATSLMHEFNQRCQPPWSDREIAHKISQAAKQPGERGYFRNVTPDKWDSVKVPTYAAPPPMPEPKETTLFDATKSYLEAVKNGKGALISLGIDELDYAIGGGVEKGEMIILAARPSHGKSAVGLQCIHYWTQEQMACVIVSEEMAAMALGKRTVQFISNVEQENWLAFIADMESEVEEYGRTHAKCVVLENCVTVEAASDAVKKAVDAHKVQCVVVDYAQLLGTSGRDRYQQMSAMSIALKRIATENKVVMLALCQMSRDIEKRGVFKPVMSDLKETGQLEQDADVIIFCCWPHKLNQTEPPDKYQFFICKNRNRPINREIIECRFVPSRQKILDDVGNFNYEASRDDRSRNANRNDSDGW